MIELFMKFEVGGINHDGVDELDINNNTTYNNNLALHTKKSFIHQKNEEDLPVIKKDLPDYFGF